MPSPVRAILFLVFVAVPLLEIALLIKVGQIIGFWWTVAIVVVTAALGTTLLHRQGMATIGRLMEQTRSGKPPVKTLVEGALLLAAGLLLLTPGLFTDSLGLVLMVPPIRSLLADQILSRVTIVTLGGGGRARPADGPRSAPGAGRPEQTPRYQDAEDGIIIEGEFERLDEKTVDPKGRRRGG
ncbi:MAG: FxsA family protein [Hyphomicrobiaceae bacterium]